MSSARDDLRSWTRRQWGGMVAAWVIVQVALAVVFAEREGRSSERAPSRGGLQTVAWPEDVTDTTRQLGVSDPLLFALPSGRGFSGEAWRLASKPAPPRVEWSEPPRWLTGKSDWFQQPSSTNSPFSLLDPQRPLSSPHPPATPLNVRPVPVAQKTRLQLDERLQKRGLQAVPELQSLRHTNLLDATVLRVAVEPDGEPFSAVVIRSSGWDRADLRALEITRQLRFGSLSDTAGTGRERQWGRVVVRWHIAPPAADSELPTPPSTP